MDAPNKVPNWHHTHTVVQDYQTVHSQRSAARANRLENCFDKYRKDDPYRVLRKGTKLYKREITNAEHRTGKWEKKYPGNTHGIYSTVDGDTLVIPNSVVEEYHPKKEVHHPLLPTFKLLPILRPDQRSTTGYYSLEIDEPQVDGSVIHTRYPKVSIQSAATTMGHQDHTITLKLAPKPTETRWVYGGKIDIQPPSPETGWTYMGKILPIPTAEQELERIRGLIRGIAKSVHEDGLKGISHRLEEAIRPLPLKTNLIVSNPRTMGKSYFEEIFKEFYSPTCPISLDEVKTLYRLLNTPEMPLYGIAGYNLDQARKFVQKYIDKMEKKQ